MEVPFDAESVETFPAGVLSLFAVAEVAALEGAEPDEAALLAALLARGRIA